MAKRTSNNSLKKIDRQLDQLLKEKKELDNTAVIKKADIIKKKNEEDAKKKNNARNRKKDDVIVAPSRKRTNKNKNNIPTSKKEIKKYTNSMTTVKKKKNRKNIKNVKMVETPKVVKQKKKEEVVGESTLKIKKLESEIRDLYEKDDNVEDIKTKEYTFTKNDSIEKNTEKVDKEEKEIPKKTDNRLREKRIYFSDVVIYGLFLIFIIMLVLFMAFIIYVCTY